MTKQEIAKRARIYSYVGFGICFAATALGTRNAQIGDWWGWAFDCGIFAASACCVIAKIRIAKKNS